MVLSSSRIFPPIIKHATPQLYFLLISRFKSLTVAVLNSAMHISLVSFFHKCFATSFRVDASGLNSNSIFPLMSFRWTNSSLSAGRLLSEVLKNVSLPFAQEEPSTIKGLDNVCLASKSHTPRNIPPNVMSTSAAASQSKRVTKSYN